ncbi:MAG TPA: nickel/cobalt transporter [Aestuariivirga sp.]|nr:nickel/cobalt transporter [Aestuariivirga sp.]
MQSMRRFLRNLLMVIILAGFFVAPAMAQTASEPTSEIKIDKKKLLVQPRNADGSLIMVSFWEDPVLWVREQQQAFYGSMSSTLRQIKSSSPYAAAWTLMFLSFGYGIFHAAGPGHGKTVISAWLLATENELKRGIVIAFLSSIIQALVAILLVSILLLLVASAGSTARDVAGFLESASYAMIGAMGLYLIWTALRPHAQHVHHNHHDHHHHDHVHDEHCGHSHVAEPKQVRGEWSLAKAFSLAFAVGIRPCTGAILVLILANALGIYWAGVASTLVMAIGTFLTVSAIAAIAVYSKKIAMRLASRDDRWLDWLGFALRIGGGLAIAGLGGLLFWGSLGRTMGMT